MTARSVLLLLTLVAAYHGGGAYARAARPPPCLGGLSRASFPQGFVFGTATSAYQVEGMADWQPEAAAGLPSGMTLRTHQEDVNLMKGLNFDAYRFSISWSRIFPGTPNLTGVVACRTQAVPATDDSSLIYEGGEGEVNEEGVAYYNNLIDYMLQKGITPYVTLQHYDLPLALEKKYGGWLNAKTVELFADYANFCFMTFGNRVKNWFTFNEPSRVALTGYDNGYQPPQRCTKCAAGGNSATEPYFVSHNLILAHGYAVARYRNKYQAAQQGKIGIVLDFSWYEGFTNSTQDQAAAQRARDFQVGWFMDPIINGQYPQTMQDIVKDRLPRFTPDQVQLVKGSSDYIGINQYTAIYMTEKKMLNQTPISYSIR